MKIWVKIVQEKSSKSLKISQLGLFLQMHHSDSTFVYFVFTGKWLACQSMDNQILIFGAQNRFRLNKKKIFKGHMVAGYACQVDFSPDMR